jgi:hypothetical protein
MILYLFSVFFLFLASVCNSIVDTVDHHQSTSIFSKLKNQLWWNSNQGWRNKYIDRDPKKGRVKWWFGLNKPVQLTDSWHFFKMWMIIFICTSIVLMVLSPALWITLTGGWVDYVANFLGQLVIMGVVWNKTFTLFYHTIWIKKT